MPAYRFHCRNPKCKYEAHLFYKTEEFEKQQYGSGWSCFKCGFPRMAVMGSKLMVKDGFKPGFQRNIRKYCSTYSEYKQHLKNMGLIEIGYEELPPEIEEKASIKYWTDDILKEIYEEDGISLDGELVKALKSGEI